MRFNMINGSTGAFGNDRRPPAHQAIFKLWGIPYDLLATGKTPDRAPNGGEGNRYRHLPL
jgi:hypothetical protein